MRVVGVIQARMGSDHYAGKMLALLAGRPLLWHAIARMRMAVSLDDLVLATSDEMTDDMLAMFAKGVGLTVLRGDPASSVERLLEAATARQAEVMVCIDANAPLVDPLTTDKFVTALVHADADYVEIPADMPLFHQGIEVMSVRVLRRMQEEAGGNALARHDAASYLRAHPYYGVRVSIDIEPVLRQSNPGLVVDSPPDLDFFEALYRAFDAKPAHLDLRGVASAFATGRFNRAAVACAV